MKNQDFYDLGNQIQDIIQSAIDSRNYQELNQTIREAVNTAVENGSEALKQALKGKEGSERPREEASGKRKTYSNYQNPSYERKVRPEKTKQEETKLCVYGKTTGEQVTGIMMTVSGGILGSAMGIGLAVSLIGKAALGLGAGLGAGLMAAGILGGIGLLAGGCRKLSTLSRFRKYVHTLGRKEYLEFDKLSRAVGKPVKYVKRDIKKMISKGWFLEGHIDRKETCLITTNEMYSQYQSAEQQLEERKKQESPTVSVDNGISREVQEVLDKGNEYLVKIRQSNDAIPGEEISGKISRMELLVQRIFERVKEHPEIIPDLKKMMDYYLPMTVKLLDAYEDMDSQPVQGENIRTSKREIEETLDTLNLAFEKILDSIFRDAAWDVSSDISVLNTILAQDGLTGSDFEQR